MAGASKRTLTNIIPDNQVHSQTARYEEVGKGEYIMLRKDINNKASNWNDCNRIGNLYYSTMCPLLSDGASALS